MVPLQPVQDTSPREWWQEAWIEPGLFENALTHLADFLLSLGPVNFLVLLLIAATWMYILVQESRPWSYIQDLLDRKAWQQWWYGPSETPEDGPVQSHDGTNRNQFTDISDPIEIETNAPLNSTTCEAFGGPCPNHPLVLYTNPAENKTSAILRNVSVLNQTPAMTLNRALSLDQCRGLSKAEAERFFADRDLLLPDVWVYLKRTGPLELASREVLPTASDKWIECVETIARTHFARPKSIVDRLPAWVQRMIPSALSYYLQPREFEAPELAFLDPTELERSRQNMLINSTPLLPTN